MVHIVTANPNRFLLGTFHSVSSKYVYEFFYEFVYQIDRRYWECQYPHQLLNAAANYSPVALLVDLTETSTQTY